MFFCKSLKNELIDNQGVDAIIDSVKQEEVDRNEIWSPRICDTISKN